MMASPTQGLISRSVSVEGYDNPVAYSPTHHVSYGYWICKHCTNSFSAGGKILHKETCPKSETQGTFNYKSPDIIYVLGDSESGRFSPFETEDIEKIKELAKSKL